MPWNYSRSVSIWQRPHSIWFSRGSVECSFGQVLLHFRSLGHIMLQESSPCLHTQTKSKAVTVATLSFIRPDYGSTDNHEGKEKGDGEKPSPW